MPDIFSYDLVEAMGRRGCPACAALEVAERRWIASFWREGRSDHGARRRFLAAGGYCPRHAWLLHESVAAAKAGSAIADLYGTLAEDDVEWLTRVAEELGSSRRTRRGIDLGRARRCPACVERDEERERSAFFLTRALRERAIRERYARSDGLCFEDLAAVVAHASTEAPEIAVFVLEDWRRRLVHVREQLAEHDRKRDHRYADEPRGTEQRSWTDVVALYSGRPPGRGEA